MFTKIVVGVDGRQGGRDAVALAKRLMAPDGTLALAHVYAGELSRWRGSNLEFDGAERQESLELLREARDDAAIAASLHYLGAPSTGQGLHVIAELIGADVLVVGSTHRGLLGRVLLGDDTRAALNGAPCAIAVAPAGYAQEPGVMREIGVGYNGSPESEHALRVARELAAEYEARLSAFEVVSLPSYYFAGGSPAVDESIEDMVKDARERIAALGGVEPHAVYGRPAEELAIYSASLDLLIVGSRDYGPLGRVVHGSTSHQLARLARCPLLVLTRAARQAERNDAEIGSEPAIPLPA
jgi:nucleotide-binding universal stress UspA family protein